MRSSLGLAALLIFVLLNAGRALAGPALLFDVQNGATLYAEDVDDQWYPASLTKIMTAYLAFDALRTGKIKPSDKITCSQLANTQPPSKVGLPVGGQMTVEVALQALIIKSANDVAVMLAEAIGGSETAFVDRMNETAQRLGMTRTHFVNANGLPAPGQVTTARDLARLSRAIIADFPEHAHYWAQTNMHMGKRRLGSHNALLKTFDGADGLKTGFTCDSGYNVVASATRDNRRLIAIVLGEYSGRERALRAASLLEHGFQEYEWKTSFNALNLDNLPVSENPKNVVSVREKVLAWGCNNHHRVAKKKNQKARAKTKNVAGAKDKGSKTAENKLDGNGAAKVSDAPDATARSTPAKAKAP
jgi:D-alanyl-D-alanine carboxypeptidase